MWFRQYIVAHVPVPNTIQEVPRRKTTLNLSLLAACAPRQPQSVLETEHTHFGDVANGENVSYDVTVLNDGNAPLVVESVSTSCGCTLATLESTTITPGEGGVLHI